MHHPIFAARTITARLVCLLACGSAAWGQALPTHGCAGSGDVGCVIPNLFGPGATGVTLPNAPGHQAHFLDNQRFTANFLPLNTAVATQLTLLPLPSPVSGYTYELDAATGLRRPKAQSLGPILTERGETLGARKLFVGFAYQRFRFSEIDGNDLGRLPIVFDHQQQTGRPFERDVITADNDIDLKIDQFTLFGTVGVTDRFDVSLAVPFLDVRLGAVAQATIRPLGNDLCGPPGQPQTSPCHVFRPNDGTSLSNTYTNGQTATGIGDVTIRLKHNLYNGRRFVAAALADVRLPTGAERNFLGSGAVGVRPFVAVSLKGKFSPHVNIGYQWNGESVLAGDITANTKGDLPNQFFYSVGTEIGVLPSLTLAVDLLGQQVFDAVRVRQTQQAAGFPNLAFETASFGVSNGSLGFKYSLVNRLLLTANVLIAMDSGGLRQRATPLIGLSYTF